MRRNNAGCYDGFCPTRYNANTTSLEQEVQPALKGDKTGSRVMSLSLRVPATGRGNLLFFTLHSLQIFSQFIHHQSFT